MLPIKKVEDVLIQSKLFHLPGKKVLQSGDTLIEIALGDAPSNRLSAPKKTTQALQRQKKASHPKAQRIANLSTEKILTTAFCYGRTHDFLLKTAAWQLLHISALGQMLVVKA
ncbi:MAG: hypothetical protein PHS96_08230 [Anaerolineales bacterium]|nr:hypothetical protein [Anaerolineales bacterium]